MRGCGSRVYPITVSHKLHFACHSAYALCVQAYCRRGRAACTTRRRCPRCLGGCGGSIIFCLVSFLARVYVCVCALLVTRPSYGPPVRAGELWHPGALHPLKGRVAPKREGSRQEGRQSMRGTGTGTETGDGDEVEAAT